MSKNTPIRSSDSSSIKDKPNVSRRKLKFHSANEIIDFVAKINLFDTDFDITYGKYAVDAKSIMGIFTLDLTRELNLIIHLPEEDMHKIDKTIEKYYAT